MLKQVAVDTYTKFGTYVLNATDKMDDGSIIKLTVTTDQLTVSPVVYKLLSYTQVVIHLTITLKTKAVKGEEH